MDRQEQTQVAIVLFDDVEVLDFCGPYEVFSTTRRHEERRWEERSPFQVMLVAEREGPVKASGGMRVLPDHTFADCPPLDILVVPGGWGTRRECRNPVLREWLRSPVEHVQTLAAVCTGSMVLAEAGLLDGLHATTHWRSLDLMRESFPKVFVEYDQHVVEDGRVVTSAGISAGIDMALKVVGRYCGEDVARATARHMEYPFPEGNRRRIGLIE